MGDPSERDPFLAQRLAMVQGQIETRGITDLRVLEAMRRVPRHRFVPELLRCEAYGDHPLPIGPRQTISQPYIVAFMAEALRLRAADRVLEIGSGCGYALAVLACLGGEVFGIEREEALCVASRIRLEELGFGSIRVRQGDGYLGWPEVAPFDAVLVSCATPELPPPLWQQLAEGGRCIYPKGAEFGFQELVLVTKTPEAAEEVHLEAVRFVPLRRITAPG